MENQYPNYQQQGAMPYNSTLTPASLEYLRGTASWMKFMSILGFIFCGFIVIVALIAMGTASTFGGMYGAGLGAGVFIVYLIMAVIILFPNIFLFNYARGIQNYFATNNVGALENAFQMQKRYWVFMGVLAIIYLSIMVLVLIIALAAGTMMRY